MHRVYREGVGERKKGASMDHEKAFGRLMVLLATILFVWHAWWSVSAQSIDVIDSDHTPLLETPWSCNDLPCRYDGVLDLRSPMLENIQMPLILIANTTRSLIICLQEDSVLMNSEVHNCRHDRTMVIQATDDSTDDGTASESIYRYVYNFTNLPTGRTYGLLADLAPGYEHENDGLPVSAHIQAYYSLSCTKERPLQNIFGYCTTVAPVVPVRVNVTADPPTQMDVNLFALTSHLFVVAPTEGPSLKYGRLIISVRCEQSPHQLEQLRLWARRSAPPMQFAYASHRVVADVSNPRYHAADGVLELYIDFPGPYLDEWYFSLMSYELMSVQLDVRLVECPTRVAIGPTCDVIIVAATNFSGNITAKEQRFAATDKITLLSVYRSRLTFGVARQDLDAGAPAVYAGWGYVPTETVYTAASTAHDAYLNFLDVESTTVKDGSVPWYVVIVPSPHAGYLVWVNDHCALNCSSSGTCRTDGGYCECNNDKSRVGIDCSAQEKHTLNIVLIIVSLSIALGLVFLIAIAIWVRRRKRAVYEKI